MRTAEVPAHLIPRELVVEEEESIESEGPTPFELISKATSALDRFQKLADSLPQNMAGFSLLDSNRNIWEVRLEYEKGKLQELRLKARRKNSSKYGPVSYTIRRPSEGSRYFDYPFEAMYYSVSRSEQNTHWAVSETLETVDQLLANFEGRVRELTPIEMKVLGLVMAGGTNRQIGDSLNISHNTVKNHVSHIFRKLGASNRTEAVMKYLAKQSKKSDRLQG